MTMSARTPGRLLLIMLWLPIAGCGDRVSDSHEDDPHPLRTADERSLAERYSEFVRALRRMDEATICRQLERSLARSYGCGGPRLILPRELRGLQVPLRDIVAADDELVPDVIQISTRTLRRDGGRLIVLFRKTRSGDWRIEQTMVGWYG